MTKLAIGYARVSSPGQASNGVSLAAQREAIEAYCLGHDLELVGIEADEGLSGKDIKHRPAVQRVLEMARTKKVEAVIIYKLDRMFRSVVDAGNTLKDFQKWRCDIVSLTENLDTTSATGRLQLHLIIAIAQWESEITGERTHEALAHKQSRGEKIGGLEPFGFDSKMEGINGRAIKVLVPNAAEQKTIRLIHGLRDNGASLGAIAGTLNERGIGTKTGKQWYRGTVRNITNRKEKDG